MIEVLAGQRIIIVVTIFGVRDLLLTISTICSFCFFIEFLIILRIKWKEEKFYAAKYENQKKADT
jgi:hypothetical protein